MHMADRVQDSPGKKAEAQMLQPDAAQVWTKNIESTENEEI